jgi:polyribonucleotide nucleotidyltransferase
MTLSAGTLDKQANDAISVPSSETAILVRATAPNTLRLNQDFFPLFVDYYEKSSTAGRTPVGSHKQKGMPSEK